MPTRRTFLQAAAGAVGAYFDTKRCFAAESLSFKLIDTHAHFVSTDFSRYPLQADAPPNLRERVTANPTTVERILALWSANGIESGIGVQYRAAYGTDNSYLLDSVVQHPDRIVPIVILDAADSKTSETFRGMVKDHGASGIRLTGMPPEDGGPYPWLDSPTALSTWEAANDLGTVVVVMSTQPKGTLPTLGRVPALAERFPNVRIVMDHIGWAAAEGAPDYGLSSAHLALREHKNVYYKLSTVNLLGVAKAGVPASDFVRHAVGIYGADHMIWGSDVGNSQGDYADFVARAVQATATLKPGEQQLLLRETARAIFVRGGRGHG